MKNADKHYKFINSSTGYSIYYYSVSSELDTTQIKIELEKVKAQVATKNGILINNVYWQEVRDEVED
ncbi:MAG: hypothetical protein EOP46_09000 [Sphingobacteriaceae bacterium]|nr:MAG: hypothetical protein EOP46_09000 [Sphingobacteriaceae bacterium]